MQNTVSFFAYFSTIKQGPNRERLAKTLILQMFYGAMFGIVLGILTNFNLITVMLGFAAFFASVPMQWARTVKPNLTSLVPLSQRRKTVYNLLSIPAIFIMFIAIAFAICFSIWLFSGLGAAAIVGDGRMIFDIIKLYTEGFEYVFADGYAAGLFISVFLFIMGAGTIYAHTDNAKYRNITVLALFGVSLIGAVVLSQLAVRYMSSLHIATYVGMYLNYFALPWLVVLLCAIAGLATLGFGIYLVIQKNKPKNY